MKRKVIVIGIDGATWKIIAPAVSSGALPNFGKVMSRSSVGVMRSTIPPFSPPAWTSMFTGVNPGKHGIVDFVLREKEGFVRCWSSNRMCKSIWQILSEAKAKCIVINDLVTFPPEAINGIMTTGMMTPPGSNNWIYPSTLRSELDVIANGYECDIPPEFSPFGENAFSVQKLNDLASKIHRVASHVALHYEWDVLAVIFTTTDRLQHFWWNDNEKILAHYKVLDSMLKDYVALANDNSADLIIVSDHGFGEIRHTIRLQDWLEESGFTGYKGSVLSRSLSRVGLTKAQFSLWLRRHPTMASIFPHFMEKLGRRYVPEAKETLDLSETKAFAKTSAGIFVEDKECLDLIEDKLRRMTVNGQELVFESVERRESVLSGPYSYRAPDLMLIAAPGNLIYSKREGGPKVTGKHAPDGIYIHYRPTARKNVLSLGTIRPWDVAASILRSLEVAIPEYFDGKPVDPELTERT